MDYNAMDYNRLLHHFDLEGNVIGNRKSGKARKGRRNSGRHIKKNEAKETEVDQGRTLREYKYSIATEEFGRLVKGASELPDAIPDDAKELGAMKRLRKRIVA